MSDDRASDRELEEGEPADPLRRRIGVAQIAYLALVPPRNEVSLAVEFSPDREPSSQSRPSLCVARWFSTPITTLSRLLDRPVYSLPSLFLHARRNIVILFRATVLK